MWFIGLVLAAAGMAIALMPKKLIELLPWDIADNAVLWIKPWAWQLTFFGLGMVVGAVF